MKKEYMLHLQFDVWSSQCWFIGEDSPETEAKWLEARRTLPELAESAANPQRFSQLVTERFKEFGFDRVHK